MSREMLAPYAAHIVGILVMASAVGGALAVAAMWRRFKEADAALARFEAHRREALAKVITDSTR